MDIVIEGTSSPSVTWELRHSDDWTDVGAGILLASGTTSDTTTAEQNFIDTVVPEDNFIWIECSENTGTVTAAHFCMLPIARSGNLKLEYVCVTVGP